MPALRQHQQFLQFPFLLYFRQVLLQEARQRQLLQRQPRQFQPYVRHRQKILLPPAFHQLQNCLPLPVQFLHQSEFLQPLVLHQTNFLRQKKRLQNLRCLPQEFPARQDCHHFLNQKQFLPVPADFQALRQQNQKHHLQQEDFPRLFHRR